MIAERIPEVMDLNPEERLQLAAELWESVASIQSDIPMNPEIKKLLDERFKHFEENPHTAVSWEEIKRGLRSERESAD